MPRRSDHPGIWLEQRQRRDGPTWYARGPGVGGRRAINLTAEMGIRTHEEANAWARGEARSVQLLRRGDVGASVAESHAATRATPGPTAQSTQLDRITRLDPERCQAVADAYDEFATFVDRIAVSRAGRNADADEVVSLVWLTLLITPNETLLPPSRGLLSVMVRHAAWVVWKQRYPTRGPVEEGAPGWESREPVKRPDPKLRRELLERVQTSVESGLVAELRERAAAAGWVWAGQPAVRSG